MNTAGTVFVTEYKKLNRAQIEAVEHIDGPVMVVAGPGTGKTQILALRIANILKETDTKADSVLCLTFTNAAVNAMRERLTRYIGEEAQKVNIFTFHSFGLEIISKYYDVLGLPEAPKLLDESEGAVFFDEILENFQWEFLRPRGDRTRYFQDLKSLFSLLKRERINTQEFVTEVKKEIHTLSTDEASISSRGASKGEIKKEVQQKIDALEKSVEVGRFLEVYESLKKEKNMLDYDDVLENLVRIVESSKEALADIREQYLYVLVDEHQDSSRVQNEFLAHTWSELEEPNIFVVGDDRQLIYGFAGASIDHFKGFQKSFPSARLIPLVENYRSTQVILDLAHALLPSVLSNDKLKSQSKEKHPLKLISAGTPHAEILAAGTAIQEKIKTGIDPNECALLVPKNAQARRALEIFHELGLPLALEEALNLFDQDEAHAFLRILKIVSDGDMAALARSFFDQVSVIPPVAAHEFLIGQNMRDFSLDKLLSAQSSLFGDSQVESWIKLLAEWRELARTTDTKALIETIGQGLKKRATADNPLVSVDDIVATILSLLEKRANASLSEFVVYLEKLAEYGEFISVASNRKKGVRVLTMHGAKGLEFDFVWIAHMDEKSLSGGYQFSFALPPSIQERVLERDADAVKRKLFVAITRAKRFCTLSYATNSVRGREQNLAKVVVALPKQVFDKENAGSKFEQEASSRELSGLRESVKQKYAERNVSASALNNFFECPWKWYFRSLLQLPEPENEHLLFGSLVHECIDKVLQASEVTTQFLAKITAGNDEALEIVKRWVKDRLPEITADRTGEQSVSLMDKKFPHLKFYGRIDLIEKLDAKNVRVTDFKTGRPRRKSEIEKLDEEGRMSNLLRQLAVYSYLIENNQKWGGVKVRESRLEFLEAQNKKESLCDRIITEKEIELLLQDIADYDSLLQGGEWVDRPCNYNSYGRNTECEYCKLAEIFD